MKTATIIFRTTPEKKAQLQKEWESSKAAVAKAYHSTSGQYGSKAWDRYIHHPDSLGAWVEACAMVESTARVKNFKAQGVKK